MGKSGRIAVYFLSLLIIAGIYLLTKLLESIDQFFNTASGQTMLVKLLVVVVLVSAQWFFSRVPLTSQSDMLTI